MNLSNLYNYHNEIPRNNGLFLHNQNNIHNNLQKNNQHNYCYMFNLVRKNIHLNHRMQNTYKSFLNFMWYLHILHSHSFEQIFTTLVYYGVFHPLCWKNLYLNQFLQIFAEFAYLPVEIFHHIQYSLYLEILL